MPTTHTEFFITVSANDIGGTTTQDETKILEHYKSWMCLLLVREKHKSGNYHLHLYIRGFANRTDNLKRKLYNLLYGQIDKDTNEWKRRIVIKPVTGYRLGSHVCATGKVEDCGHGYQNQKIFYHFYFLLIFTRGRISTFIDRTGRLSIERWEKLG